MNVIQKHTFFFSYSHLLARSRQLFLFNTSILIINSLSFFAPVVLLLIMDSPELEKRISEHLLGGGALKQQERKKKGKLTAFDRIEGIFDSGTFTEIDPFVTHECHNFEMQDRKFLGDGVVTGYGMIDNRLTYVFSHDFTVLGGSLAMAFALKVCKVMDFALNQGVPIVGINDTGGSR
jgi:propionyl-CoA carboxylase beta chain